MTRLAQAFVATNARADLYAIVDKDDPKFDEYLDNKNYQCLVLEENTGLGALAAHNHGVKLLLDSSIFPFYDYFFFMGDDCLPQTLEWDAAMEKALAGKTGIAYANDLIQGENLTAHFAITRNIVERMQGLAPAGLKHLYADNFIYKLGQDLDCLIYLPEVILQHLHPVAGTAEWDEGYLRVNDENLYKQDFAVYQSYINSAEYADLIHALK